MKKLISALVVMATVATSFVGCGYNEIPSSGIIATSSGGAETCAKWLADRLTGDGESCDGIILGTAETADGYGVDLTGLKDDGFIIRRVRDGGDTLIFGKTDDGLDRGVRYYANYCDETGALSITMGEGYRIGSITVCGADISEYVIVTPADPFYTESYAATELQKYINKAVGAELSIISETEWDGDGYAFVLAKDTSEDKALGEEAFTIRSHEGGITITGGYYRGVMYGVYTFLEDYIGWRFYYNTNGVSGGAADDAKEYLYAADSIVIGTEDIDVFEEAGINYRCVYNGVQPSSPKLKFNGYKYRGSFGVHNLPDNACHGFGKWFTDAELQQWGPTPDTAGTNPCFSNPEMIDELCVRLKNHLDEWSARSSGIDHPTHVDISHYDIGAFCKCDGCLAIMAETGAVSGVTLTLANTVAEYLESVGYDYVRVHTFAYYGTDKPPRNLVAHPQVQVSYCFYIALARKGERICGNHSISGEGCSLNSECFVRDFLDWSEICENIHVWYYPGSYYYSVNSSPRLHQIYYDAKFLAESGVDGVFALYGSNINLDSLVGHNMMEQMFWQTPDTFEEYNELLLEYCKLIYGETSGEFVYEYLMIMEEAGDRKGCWSNLHDSPVTRLDYSFIKESSERILYLFRMAHRYAESAYGEELVDRLFTASLFNVAAANHYGWWTNGDDESRARYKELLDSFCELGVRYGIILDDNGGTVPAKGTFDYDKIPFEMFKETIGKWDYDPNF